MNKNLLIIESPNKIETIKKYLKNKDFNIIATIGHVRDLKTNGMGFNEKTLEPDWVISSSKNKFSKKSKKELVQEIREVAKKAEKIYLATDPDREGEAIAWHVYEILDQAEKEKSSRITFNEITEEAILNSLKNPRKIDLLWVQSQFCRRVLDRLVGYKLSKIVKQKLRAKSAGRVQSVALKFIYDREQEIKSFVETKWWTLDVTIENDHKLILRKINPDLKDLDLVSDDKKTSGIDFASIESANKVKDNLTDQYKIYAIDEPKSSSSNPREPYKTSTLQQDAINRLNWNVDIVTNTAQKLYEGVDIKNEKVALITYPRTDSTRINEQFKAKVKQYIEKTFGFEYYADRHYENKKASDNIQNAHEAIRVIDPYITPESIKDDLSVYEYKLYELIWLRTIAAFMSSAKIATTVVRIINNENKFYTYQRKIIFDGYKKIYAYQEDDQETEKTLDFNLFKVNHVLKASQIAINEHKSLPPSRYTQASLIKALDDAGVGRPSTYRSMANMAIERGYARIEKKAYYLNDLGSEVIQLLDEHFGYITDKEFTREMEQHLDDIADKEENWKEWIFQFKPKFDADILKVSKQVKKKEDEKVGRKCPECGSELVYRRTKKDNKKFVGCSNFPKCTYNEFPKKPMIAYNQKCPECGHDLLVKLNKRKIPFIACSNFPKCKYAASLDKEKETYYLQEMKKLVK